MQSEQKRSGVSVGGWMGAQLLFAIPVVNIIALIVIAATTPNRSKRNYCIAALVWMALAVVAFVLAIMFFGPQIVDWCKQMSEALAQPPI